MRSWFAGAVVAAFCTGSVARAEPTEVASFENGTFLENLVRAANGHTFVTNYFARQIVRLATDGEISVAATLPFHPVGIARDGEGFVVTGHRVPFSDFPAFTTSNLVAVFAADWRPVSEVAAPQAKFLNGIVPLADGAFLIADSIAGTIWRFDSAAKQLSVFAQSSLLAPDAAATTFRPGANGIKISGDTLFVSNSSRGAIYSTPLGDPAALAVYATTGPVDDFVIAAGGRIIAATHGERLLSISANREVSVLLDTGCDGCTSVELSADGSSVLLLTTGNMLEGGKLPARILSVPLGSR